MNITINGVRTTSDYLTSFFADSHPSLVFERDGVVFNYQIIFTPNSYTEIIGLRSTTPNLPTSYFHKVENNVNEIPPLQAPPISTTPLSTIDDLPTYEELFPDITGSYVGFLEYNQVRLNLTYTTNSYELLTSTGQSSGTIRFHRSSDQNYIRFQNGLLHGELFSINSDSNLIRIGHNTIFTKE